MKTVMKSNKQLAFQKDALVELNTQQMVAIDSGQDTMIKDVNVPTADLVVNMLSTYTPYIALGL